MPLGWPQEALVNALGVAKTLLDLSWEFLEPIVLLGPRADTLCVTMRPALAAERRPELPSRPAPVPSALLSGRRASRRGLPRQRLVINVSV